MANTPIEHERFSLRNRVGIDRLIELYLEHQLLALPDDRDDES